MNIRNIRRQATAVVAALVVSTFFVGAAVGPVSMQGGQVAVSAAQISVA